MLHVYLDAVFPLRAMNHGAVLEQNVIVFTLSAICVIVIVCVCVPVCVCVCVCVCEVGGGVFNGTST